MLRELHISNLAVISDARIEFAPGLNCFTGSTGAGKSLVIGALQVLLGMRSPAEMLRPGADEGRVSGVFELHNLELLRDIGQLTDLQLDGSAGEILLTRRLYASGRSSISLNANPITLSMLKTVAEALVDVHGQHDHQFLLKTSNQLDVLDEFGESWPLRQKYRQSHEKLHDAARRLKVLSANRALRRQQLDLYRFQADEIASAQLNAAECQQLESRSSVLKNLEKLKRETAGVYSALYDADDSALERLNLMSGVLADVALLDARLKQPSDNMRDAVIALEEVAYDISRYLDKLDIDPAELAEVDDRLNAINRVVNKYGRTLADTLALRDELGRKIAELEQATDDLASLQREIEPLHRELQEVGHLLSAKRQTSAAKLAPLVEKQLAELGMEKAKFQISLLPAGEPGSSASTPPGETDETDNVLRLFRQTTPSGLDKIEFIAQTNPGQLAQPLRKIASGGELSRIMLALKGILAQSDRVSVLVFDEIDSNVGGRLGSVIGSKLRNLARHHQVLCITHLPQIACYADRHLTVRKEISNGQTESTVRLMIGQERIEELAAMIGGQRITDTNRAQARELLESAQQNGIAPDQSVAATAKPVATRKAVNR